jgi:addiction module RelB/DinJ family antitoxin
MSDIRVIIQDDLKHNAESILHDLDLTMSQAVRMFLKQIVKRGELPFNPYKKIYNKETIEAMTRSQDDKYITKYKSVDDMFNSWDED